MLSLKQRFVLDAKLLSLSKMKTSFLLLSLNRNIALRNREIKLRIESVECRVSGKFKVVSIK